MGTDLTNEKESDFEKDFQNENFKYDIISKKCKEKSNDDNYIISPNIKISEGEIDIDFSLFGVFDGHNGNYVSKYLSQNINKFFENALKKINKKNYKPELEKLFTEIDK
jgi:serine/threonine protein phosphatase PrpC